MDLSRLDLKADQARRCYYTDEPMPVPSFSELQAFLHEDTAAIRYMVDLLTVAHKRIEALMERVQRLERKEAQVASTSTPYETLPDDLKRYVVEALEDLERSYEQSRRAASEESRGESYQDILSRFALRVLFREEK